MSVLVYFFYHAHKAFFPSSHIFLRGGGVYDQAVYTTFTKCTTHFLFLVLYCLVLCYVMSVWILSIIFLLCLGAGNKIWLIQTTYTIVPYDYWVQVSSLHILISVKETLKVHTDIYIYMFCQFMLRDSWSILVIL